MSPPITGARGRRPAAAFRRPAGSGRHAATALSPAWAAVLVVAVVVSVVGLLLMAVVAMAAPNDHTLGAAMPLLRLPALDGPASTELTLAAIAAQGAGLTGMLAASGRGWRPRPAVLLAAGTGAACLLAVTTPVGSGDMASYAAYGRIASLGLDPYRVVPAHLGGHYADLVSTIWVRTPSVYGPVATFVQSLAATTGGHRVLVTIGLLMAANAAAYLATGVILVRAAADRSRAALLWAGNPLLLALLVGGGHLDTYVALFGVSAAALAARPQDWHGEALIGALLGLACGVKVSAALLVVGLSWPLLRERQWDRLLTRSVACLAVLVLLYAPVGPHALAPLSGASHLVSTPSVWQFVQWAGHILVGPAATPAVIGVAWPLAMLLAAYLLLRCRSTPPPGGQVGQPGTAHALSFGWNLAAPWCMPWYTAMTWPLTALLPRSRTDYLLVALTTGLALVHNTGGHGWTW